MILCIETATDTCSVALCGEEEVISLREETEGRLHASLLAVFVSEIFSENNIKASDLSAVAVSKGPGSFTGLRIGVSTAKGLAYGANIPLIGTDTLTSMFHGVMFLVRKAGIPAEGSLFCPVIDAKGMEVYYCLFDSTGNLIKETSAEKIDENSFLDIPSESTLIFFGPGAHKCFNTTRIENKILLNDYRISARDMMIPAWKSFREQKFENIAYFEPFYLKDFIPTKPGKKVI